MNYFPTGTINNACLFFARRKRYFFLGAIVAAMLLPFSGKPFFIDDYYHYLMAKGIIEKPLRPYDFLSDDDGHDNPGWEYGALPRMVNPPMTHYSLALIIKLLGGTERAAHVGFMFFAIVSAISFLFIAERFLGPQYDFLSAMLFVFNPVFWITSTGLMLDSVKLTFYLLALAFLVFATERKNFGALMISGFFMGLAILSKYTAFSIIPLAFIYLIMFDKMWKKNIMVFLIPLFMVLVWSYWNIRTYGSPHLTSALKRTIASSLELKVLVALVFLSGGLIFPVGIFGVFAITDSLKRFKWLFFLLSCIVLVTGIFVFSSRVGGFTLLQSVLISLWLTVSLDFIVSIILAWGGFDKKDRFIALWFALVFLMMLPAMAWTAGRYFMAVVPPASLIFVRMVDILLRDKIRQKNFLIYGSVAVTFILGSLLAFSDYAQANVYRKIQQDLRSDGIRPSYFKSDIFSGITGYLKSDGWRIVVPGEDVLKPGDLFLIGYISTPVAWIKQPEIRGRLELVKIYEYRGALPFRLVSVPDSAGFYATCWGALPWSISNLPLERYKLYKVVP